MDNVIFLSVFFLLEFFPSFLLVSYPCFGLPGSCWIIKMVIVVLAEGAQSQSLVYCRTWPYKRGFLLSLSYWVMELKFLGNLLYTSWFQYVTGAVIILLELTPDGSFTFAGSSTRKKRLQLRDKGQRVRL